MNGPKMRDIMGAMLEVMGCDQVLLVNTKGRPLYFGSYTEMPEELKDLPFFGFDGVAFYANVE